MNLTVRINRIIGQLKGIDRMSREDRECTDILQQIAAVKKAIDGLSKEIVLRNITGLLADKESKRVERMLARAIDL